VATVNLWQRVGAKEEQAVSLGFAHLFEHLMFIARTAVKADVTGPALKEFLAEINSIRTGDIKAAEAARRRRPYGPR
jgi:predicted Zn-dependent peptidase